MMRRGDKITNDKHVYFRLNNTSNGYFIHVNVWYFETLVVMSLMS